MFKISREWSTAANNWENKASIVCSSCGAVERYGSAKSAINHTGAAQHFRKKGWSVGAGPNADKCPACLARVRVAAPPAPITGWVDRVRDQAKAANVPVPPPLPAIKKEMDKASARIIFAELNDAYVDEKTGYKPGKDDASIAKGLGVDVEWVIKVREQHFGPIVDEKEDLKELLEEVIELRTRVSQFGGTVLRIKEELDAIKNKYEGLLTDRGDLVEKMNDLKTRLERAIGRVS